MDKKLHIINSLVSSTGGDESSRVDLITDIKTGKSELVIEKTITERYPVQKYEDVMDLFDQLNRGGGRRKVSLKELTK